MEQLSCSNTDWPSGRRSSLGITSLLVAIGDCSRRESLHANKQTAEIDEQTCCRTSQAAQIDQDDKAAIEKIRERNRQKTAEPLLPKIISRPSKGETHTS